MWYVIAGIVLFSFGILALYVDHNHENFEIQRFGLIKFSAALGSSIIGSYCMIYGIVVMVITNNII